MTYVASRGRGAAAALIGRKKILDVVVRQGTAVLELLPGEDEALLVGRNALLVLNLLLHVLDRVGGLDFESDGLSGQGLDEDLHPTTQAEHKVKGGFLVDVVVGQSTTVLELLAGENQALLVGRNALLVLNLLLYVLDRVRSFHLKGNGLSGKGFDEDLHASTETKDEVEGGFLLDVVVGQGTAVLELLTSEDEALLVGRNALLVLNLLLHILDRVGGFYLKSNGLSGQSLDEDLHTTAQAEHKVEGRLLLDVVVGQRTAVLELLPGEDETLLVGRNAFLVLDLLLHVLDRVRGLDFEGDGLSGQGLDEDLHASTETEDEVESGLLLDVVVGQGTAVLELLPGEDEALLVGRNAFLVLDLLLHVFDRVGGLDFEGNGLAS